MPDGVTKITLTGDMAIRALKHMDDYTLPPEDAPREDMLAYRYLMWKDTEKLRIETERLARHKEVADMAIKACGSLLRFIIKPDLSSA